MLSTTIMYRTLTHLKCSQIICQTSPKFKAWKSNTIQTTRGYGKKKSSNEDANDICKCIEKNKEPLCNKPCEGRRTLKRDSILHRIKLKVIEGGTNFGTPFYQLKCDETEYLKDRKIKKLKNMKAPVLVKEKHSKKKSKDDEDAPKKIKVRSRPGVQVSILGADTHLGQYVALLLKQCPAVNRLNLYEATDTSSSHPNRDICKVLTDLQHIDTNCEIQAFSYHYCQLERCLQKSDIVVMLESNCVNASMSLEQRFDKQAPMVKGYSHAIVSQCPEAFVIVCTTPIDCMVPLVAETLRDANLYDCRKVMGSMAVPEMRASTLAARALCLEPRYTRVPCVGGSEGETIVPLFSKAVEFFSFNEYNTDMLTKCVRASTTAIENSEKSQYKRPDLSEAHAVSKLVKDVAHALLCQDVPRLTAFVETHAGHVVSPARFIANTVEIDHRGISRHLGLPKMNGYEAENMDRALTELRMRLQLDKLLNKLEENEPELASSPEEECVICVNAKATMQTSPCGHRVVCRRCFVKTIQMAVSQRLLPLRCVICRAKILRLRQTPRLVTSKSWQVSSGSGKSWSVPGSVSSYSVGARSVPASASLYSVTSGESSLSGVSSVSSTSSNGVGCSTKLCGGSKCGGACLGAVPRVNTAPPRVRQPASHSLRRSQHHSMKARLQEYQQVHSYTGGPGAAGEPSGRLPPIREFQREFREGRRESVVVASSSSTRIRCAQKIVTQLETSPQKKVQHFFRPLKPAKVGDARSRDSSKENDCKTENPKNKPKNEDKKKKEEDKNKKDEKNDNKKNEIAEKKKEEKLRLKAEKDAEKEAKLLAKEEEKQAKLLAKEEKRQAKLLAKEEKKKAKKEAKLAAQAEKEKSK